MISCIVPTLNEKDNIEEAVRRIEQAFTKAKLRGEIVIVDDESEDGTGEIARKLARRYGNIQVVSRKTRDGAGAAHLAGYKTAKGSILISMEADLSTPPEEIPDLVKKIEEGYDIVVASRYAKGATTNKKRVNVFVSKWGNKLISLLSGVKISDFTIAYRAIRKPVIANIETKEKDGNPFLMECIFRAGRKGYKITEIPTHYTERKRGETKNKLFGATLRTFLAAVRLWLSRG